MVPVAWRPLMVSGGKRRSVIGRGVVGPRGPEVRRLIPGGSGIRTLGPPATVELGAAGGARRDDAAIAKPEGSKLLPSTGESTANLISLPGASRAHILRKRRTIGDDRGARVLQEADLPEGGARGSLGRWRRGSLQDRVRLVGRRLQIGAGTPSPCRSSSGWITPASPDAP